MKGFAGCAFRLKIEKKLILRNNKKLRKIHMLFVISFDLFLKIIRYLLFSQFNIVIDLLLYNVMLFYFIILLLFYLYFYIIILDEFKK